MSLSGSVRGALPALMVLLLGVTPVGAAEGFVKDGWHTWRVAALDDAPDWCCYDWNAGQATRKACNLGSKHINYGHSNEQASAPEFMQMYALIDDGRIARLRTLSPRCEVESNDTLTDLGIVETDTSVRWLEEEIAPRSDLSPHALAAISVHEGAAAKNTLEDVARRGRDLENRKDAVFWMAQSRIADSGSTVRELMRDDDDAEIRQHALFAYAQSAAPDRIEALIAVIEDRSLSQGDRKKALFWLAQTESDQAIAYLERLLVRN